MSLKNKYSSPIRNYMIQEIYRKLWISADFENDITESFFNEIQVFHSGETFKLKTEVVEDMYIFSERY